MIDLHLHTTASDGRSSPEALVREAAAAGCHTIAVTDHDTVGGLGAARAEADRLGLTFYDGIEVTAVHHGRDVHILGYFIDVAHAGLASFLTIQRAQRRDRLTAMVEQLARAGAPVDIERVLALSPPGRSLGRPVLARALVEAGYVADIAEAFDRYLSEGRPGYAGRDGATPSAVVAEIRGAGGIASIAHPGKLQRDEIIEPLIAEGLGGIEVFHPDHAPADVERYREMAVQCGVCATGGSDYHGPGSGRSAGLGVVSLPPDALRSLLDRLAPFRPE